MTITETAKRIVRRHNSCYHIGGILAFNADGTGGEWYSASARPNAAILFPVARRTITPEEVQDWLAHEEPI